MSLSAKEFEAHILTAQEVGILKGENKVLREQILMLNGELDGVQDDLDLMRERSVRAETELGILQKAMKQIEDLKL